MYPAHLCKVKFTILEQIGDRHTKTANGSTHRRAVETKGKRETCDSARTTARKCIGRLTRSDGFWVAALAVGFDPDQKRRENDKYDHERADSEQWHWAPELSALQKRATGSRALTHHRPVGAGLGSYQLMFARIQTCSPLMPFKRTSGREG